MLLQEWTTFPERKVRAVPDGGSRPSSHSRPEGQTPYVTSAVGLEETAGRLRARRTSLFTQTIVWVTGLICLAFLLGALVQAWSNYQLAQNLQQVQQQTQQLQNAHNNLEQQVKRYQDPYVIESEARLQLGYGRPGEHIVVVATTANQSQPQNPSTANTAGGQGFWHAWWDIFFGNE